MIAAGRLAPSRCAARLLPLEPGFYAIRLVASVLKNPGSDLAVPAVQVAEPPGAAGTIVISDAFGRPAAWLGPGHEMLFVSVAAGGAAALVTAYLADTPVELEICRIAVAATVASAAALPPLRERRRLMLAAPDAAPTSSRQVPLDAVAHIRDRGDVRFVEAPWVGRLGGGLWIEALTLAPRDPSAVAAIEYKGLIAGGTETAWTGCGAPCGTQGRGLPLIGIAVRQKAGSPHALFDCEYTGYFQSGATAGPARNGAPCRSTVDGDPLEGLQLRITRRLSATQPVRG